MKLNILSDLHLAMGALPRPRSDADVVILAGDIARPEQAIEWAAGFPVPVLYVPGNHEFYRGSIQGTVARLKHLAAGTCVRVLDRDEAVLGGVRFVGATLWTDLLINGGGERQAQAIAEATRLMYDFTHIRAHENSVAPFTPGDSAVVFRAHSAWLREKFAEPYAGPTVVITHHAPSPQSIHPRFAGSLLNPCFVSDAEALVEASGASLWVHGHTHDSFDYRIGGTRVVCNPRGYLLEGREENPLFDPAFTVEVGARAGVRPAPV